jgi:CheY-like chemotaxis protein
MMFFISYQRADTLFAAHALFYAIREAGHAAFVDTGSIRRGESFPEVISNAVSKAHGLLALIGPSFNIARLQEATSVVAYEWRRAQFHSVTVVPVLVAGGRLPPDADLPPALRGLFKRNAYALRPESFAADVAGLIQDLPVLATLPRRAARVLWVDDNPANNEGERRTLRSHGIVFDNVVSTTEATDQLANERYDLVITDLGRTTSSDRSPSAGIAFLRHPAVTTGGPPVIVYAGVTAMAQREALLGLGAAEVTADRQRLIDSVLTALGRAPEVPRDLTR